MAADSAAIANALPASVVDAKRRNARDARADGLFRWLVAAAGMFVLLTLTGAALSMLWGGREAFSTFGKAVYFENSISAAERELAYLTASVVNNCHY